MAFLGLDFYRVSENLASVRYFDYLGKDSAINAGPPPCSCHVKVSLLHEFTDTDILVSDVINDMLLFFSSLPLALSPEATDKDFKPEFSFKGRNRDFTRKRSVC